MTRENRYPLITVYARDRLWSRSLYWRLFLTRDEAQGFHGDLFSCGLTVGEEVSEDFIQDLVKAGRAEQVSYDEWNHSGCQSSCIRRGGKECHW